MQYIFLTFIVFTLLAILIGRHMKIRSEKKRFNLRSNNAGLDKIREEFFLHVDKNMFIKTWVDFSEVVGVAPEKLRESDTIKVLSGLFVFSELFYEDIEDFLKENNVAKLPRELSSYSVKDMLDLVFEETSNINDSRGT